LAGGVGKEKKSQELSKKKQKEEVKILGKNPPFPLEEGKK